MADDTSDCSVSTSLSTVHYWWSSAPQPHPSNSPWNNHWNPNSNPNHTTSSCEEDISTSFTNASNHSGLSVESQELVESTSHMDLSAEPASDNHIWNQVLISVGSNGGLNNDHNDGENMLEALSNKSLSTEMFEPGCDFMKKSDNYWEITNPTSVNSLIEHERLTNLSDLVCNWSLAPPEPELDHQQVNISLNSAINRYTDQDLSQFELTTGTDMKLELPNSSNYSSTDAAGTNSDYIPCFGYDVKEEIQEQMGSLSNSQMSKVYYDISDEPWSSSTRNFTDLISFGGCLNKPLMDFQASEPCLKASNLHEYKKSGNEGSSLMRENGKGQGPGEGKKKKKRSDDNSEILFKKPKHESSAASLKMQVPKAKLGDRISTLQQLVSPFGKTDTASVLLEAIRHIKFLQEQVQLLSNPYMKSSGVKKADHNLWGGLERREKVESKLDLKSKGLCLVPISCAPQVYRENGGVDYWTPTYRGFLYR